LAIVKPTPRMDGVNSPQVRQNQCTGKKVKIIHEHIRHTSHAINEIFYLFLLYSNDLKLIIEIFNIHAHTPIVRIHLGTIERGVVWLVRSTPKHTGASSSFIGNIIICIMSSTFQQLG